MNTAVMVLMGQCNREWQEIKYVLSLFGKSMGTGRKLYLAYVDAGAKQGRRSELVGGGLIRSLGGWRAVKQKRFEKEELYSGSRRQAIADAKGLFCYWAVHELGYPLTKLAKALGRTGPGIGYAVQRGEQLANRQRYKLIV